MTTKEAIKFYADEVLFLETVPKINKDVSDVVKAEWARQAEIHRMAIAALRAKEEKDG